ncbi:Hypothetical protein SRAE_2000232500 [Strongyloides ratti]|uniref:RecQ-mediated genome instability protein 1 n=1 Tax=Strongyloides ratti TaxID=34506 RepID=A0A090MYR9_STRRB|nr:Hypothetical protein SRAE_2000232500 [Strongyloides ratti]CEF67664.1 Hypothetical protein SRAE_2000232500 [Strongyloides ratti]
MEELLSIKNYFKSINISLTDDFLLAVKKFYTEIKGAVRLIPFKDFVFYQWLHCDIGDTTTQKCLPLITSTNGTVLINQVFQINWAVRIDIPLYSIYTELSETKADLAWFDNRHDTDDNFNPNSKCSLDEFEKNRVLLMELSDGSNIIQAIEKEPILNLKTILNPGTKVAICGYVSFSNKILYINNKLAKILGGNVEEQYNRNNTMSVIERKLHLPHSLKVRIKQIQNCKKKRISLPESSEGSKKIMEEWLNKSKKQNLSVSNDSDLFPYQVDCHKDDLDSTISSISTEISYGSDIVSRDHASTLSIKKKNKIDDLFQSPSNKVKKNKNNASDRNFFASPKLKKITEFCTPMKKKFTSLFVKKEKEKFPTSSENNISILRSNKVNRINSNDDIRNTINDQDKSHLKFQKQRAFTYCNKENNSLGYTPLRRSDKKEKGILSSKNLSQEGNMDNKIFNKLFNSPKFSIPRFSQNFSYPDGKNCLKNKEVIKEKKSKLDFHYELDPQSVSGKSSNSSTISRLFSTNQFSPPSSIIPSLGKVFSKIEKDTLSNTQYLKPHIYQTQDRYFGIKDDKVSNSINLKLDSRNIKPKIVYRRQSLNTSGNRNLDSSYNKYNCGESSHIYEDRSNSCLDINIMNTSNDSLDFDMQSFTMSNDRSTISLTQTPLHARKRVYLNTSNNSDALFSPPNKFSKHSMTQQEKPQQPIRNYYTINEALNLVSMSFGFEKLNVLAKVTKVVKGLSIQNNQWTMEIEITDENNDVLGCLIHDSFISYCLGETALEISRGSSNKCTNDKIEEKAIFFLKKLQKGNLIFSIDLFATQSIMPLIRKIRTIERFEQESSQMFSQYTFSHI